MRYIEHFKINGSPMLVPDQDVAITQNDLDSEDSGRDESGVMHRVIIRERVKTWAFNYFALTAEEYQYMESLFAGNPEFEFTYPNPDGTLSICQAYCSNNSITVRNLRTGHYTNYKFNIIEC